MHKCVYCNKEYSSKGILENHQKTAKFCLRLRNTSEIKLDFFKCSYCEDNFTQKDNLDRHYERCKIRIDKVQEENEQKKDELIIKLKEENQNYKTENLIQQKELKIKDDIIFKLEKEIESLKNKVDDTYMTLLDRSDKTYNTFFEKEEKLVDTLLNQNNSSKNSKSINNNLIINNYGIKPITAESVINAFESYNLKQKDAFNGYLYDLLDLELDNGNMKGEYVFYGIIRELKDYYGITDISREKIIFNNNGELTLTTIQEFIRTNVVMNNIDAILEWIYNLLSQVKQKIAAGEIEMPGPNGIREMRDMTQQEKIKLRDTGKTLEFIYNLFKTSKEKGTVNTYMTKWLSDGAMKVGKVISKIKSSNLLKNESDENNSSLK